MANLTNTGPSTAEAIAKVRSGESFGVQELVDSGLLYRINASFFHNWGFKLVPNEDGSFSMAGDGKQQITHDLPLAKKRNDALLKTMSPIDRPPLDWFRALLD
jgi:hypothetical protein